MKLVHGLNAATEHPVKRSPSRFLRSQWAQIALILPLAIGCLSVMAARPALSQEQLMRILTVTGQGSESVQTTQAQVMLGVEAQADTADEAQAEVARRSTAVVAFLRSRNVSELETTGISLNPIYNYESGEQRIVGYGASNTVSFRTPTEASGEIVDGAVRAGASQISGVQFIASDAAIAQARSQALAEATRDAQSQADSVLSALGFSAQEIVNIQIDSANMPPVYPPYAQRALADGAEATTPIIGGEQDVEARVTLQIRY